MIGEHRSWVQWVPRNVDRRRHDGVHGAKGGHRVSNVLNATSWVIITTRFANSQDNHIVGQMQCDSGVK